MTIDQARARGIFRIKIALATAFEKELPAEEPARTEAQQDNDRLKEYAEAYRNEWIVLREPKGTEIVGITDSGKDKSQTKLAEIFDDCLIDWSFTASEGVKAERKAVIELIKESSSLYLYVLQEWGTKLPLARKSGRASVAPLAQ
jgi:hypothetical protein